MNQRQSARITGWSLLLMAIVAGFSIGYAFPEFYQPEQINSLKDNLLGNEGLYQYMLIAILIILLLDLVVSYTLYNYFKTDHKNLAITSSVLRVIYTLIFGVAVFYLTKNLNTNELTNQELNANYQQFQSIWNGGLILFGFHIFLVGLLMKLHKRVPKILWYLALIAGVSYVVVHLLKLTNPGADFVVNLEMILALPMAIGELGLAVWLLIKGGKQAVY